jgi:hypothetical protein
MLGVLDHFWPPVVTCYATEDAVRIVNSFYLQSQSLIPLLHVRHYNHSQLFLTLCHIYTAYNLTRSQSLLYLSHGLRNTPDIFTLPVSVSYRDLTRRTNKCLLRHSSSSYKTLNHTSVTAATNLLLLPCDVTAACCVGTVFQYCCMTSSRLRGNLVYQLVLGNGLRNLCCVTQQWVDMSQYNIVTCIPSARQRLGKHVPAVNALFSMWLAPRPLLCYCVVNTPKTICDNRRRCFPWSPCKVVIKNNSIQQHREN